MNNTTMLAKDSISAKMARCTIEIDGKRYDFFNMINLEAKFEKSKSEVAILGQTAVGHKATGWKGTGSATMHYNTSLFRQKLKQYMDNGTDFYFDIIVENEDPTSASGAQSVILKNCNIDNGILAKFDASSEDPLDEEFEFTFEGFEFGVKDNGSAKIFNDLNGFRV